MNNIPNEFKINKQINHKEYLIDGIISKWDGNQTNVYSTLLCDKDDKEPYLLGNTPEMSGEYALKALEAAHSAFNFGKTDTIKFIVSVNGQEDLNYADIKYNR